MKSKLREKLIYLNYLTSESEVENLITFNKKNNTENTKKISKGMLWHMRLRHPSIEYVMFDDFSRYARVYYLKHKNESGKCLEKYLEHMRNILGKHEKICYIRSGNGTEFTRGTFADVMRKEQIS